MPSFLYFAYYLHDSNVFYHHFSQNSRHIAEYSPDLALHFFGIQDKIRASKRMGFYYGQESH
jgi:hypothetical protein